MAEKKAGGAFQSVSCRCIPPCCFETTLLKTAQVVNKDRTQRMMSKISCPVAVPLFKSRVSPSIALFQLATFARIQATNHHMTVSLFPIVHPMNAGSWLGKTHVCSDADTDVLTSMV